MCGSSRSGVWSGMADAAAARAPGPAPLTDSASRRPNMIQFVCVKTVSSAWFSISNWKRTSPREGRLVEGRLSRTVMRVRRVSPGLTGLSHFTSSMPGAPREVESRRNPSATRRMLMLQVCQPEAMSVPMKLSLAATSSTWKGCASYSRAKAVSASLVTV